MRDQKYFLLVEITLMQSKDGQRDIDFTMVKFQGVSGKIILQVVWCVCSSEEAQSFRNSKQILADMIAKGFSKHPPVPL